jgi:hypothetical protein
MPFGILTHVCLASTGWVVASTNAEPSTALLRAQVPGLQAVRYLCIAMRDERTSLYLSIEWWEQHHVLYLLGTPQGLPRLPKLPGSLEPRTPVPRSGGEGKGREGDTRP